MIITRAILHTALYHPLWWLFQEYPSPFMKFLNLANQFYMILYWLSARNKAVEAIKINTEAYGKAGQTIETPSETHNIESIKLALITLAIMFLMELAIILTALTDS